MAWRWAFIRRTDSCRVRGAVLALGAIVVLSLGATNVFSGWRFYNYATAAHWLNDNTSHTEVAITEFGLFGWEVGRPLVEYVGLLSAQSVEDLRNHGLVARAERARLLGGARAPWVPWETEALNHPWFLPPTGPCTRSGRTRTFKRCGSTARPSHRRGSGPHGFERRARDAGVGGNHASTWRCRCWLSRWARATIVSVGLEWPPGGEHG